MSFTIFTEPWVMTSRKRLIWNAVFWNLPYRENILQQYSRIIFRDP